MKCCEWLLAHPCIPKIINLIDNRLFGGSFLPSILVTTNSRHPAIISPSLVLNRIELTEIHIFRRGTTLASPMTAQCSSPVVKSIGDEPDVSSERIDTRYTSLSVYPDVRSQLIAAESSSATSNNCLIVLPSTLKRAYLSGKFIIAKVLIKKSTPRMAEVSSWGDTRNVTSNYSS